MFDRTALNWLDSWKKRPDRKPLVIRGARQVGKTSLVKLFSRSYAQFIMLNLDSPGDRMIFDDRRSFQDILAAIFFLKRKSLDVRDTLIFIDEIQNSAHAVMLLRYFFEEAPDLHVIAAGSMLESLVHRQLSFPVGRVEYMVLHPCSFREFLGAMGEEQALEMADRFPVPEFAHTRLMHLFNQYALTGGMPEVVRHYSEHRDLTALGRLYGNLVTSYQDDVEKYARNQSMIPVIRHVIRMSFRMAGTRITFERFGQSNYRSREVGEAFRALEQTGLLFLIYPVESQRMPMVPNFRKSPRLQVLDTGLLNYYGEVQHEVFRAHDITDAYRGLIAEHIVGQELLSAVPAIGSSLHFWTREERNSQAEVDFVVVHEGGIIPVEVKSGAGGKLKSLHLFMAGSPQHVAVRFQSAGYSVEKVRLNHDQTFRLVNLPYYLAGQLFSILDQIA